MSPDDGDRAAGDRDPEASDRRTERAFTCTACGFPTTHRVGRLRTEVRATCPECADWTVQAATPGDVVAEARSVADDLAGTILTERQALAYLLREVVGLGREATAEAMDTSASNVDNLHRRGREKVADARRIVEDLAVLSGRGAEGESG